MILLCKTISLIDYLLKIAAWLFPSLATIISAIIIVYLGSWLIGKKLANIEELRILNRTKYQWKYDLLKSTNNSGLEYIKSTTTFGKVLSEYIKAQSKERFKNSIVFAKNDWWKNYRNVSTNAVQAKCIFKNKGIHDELNKLLAQKYVNKITQISNNIINADNIDPIEELQSTISEMTNILENVINLISNEIANDFRKIGNNANN